MAGRKQHYIPQFLLRGFSVPTSKGRADQVFVFQKDRKPFLTSTEGVAAERFFYSELASASEETLDDRITKRESNFSSLVVRLRASPAGTRVDANAAAELVAHLTMRNAHIRDSFGLGVRSLFSHVKEMLSSEEGLRRLLGVDLPKPNKMMQEELRKALFDQPVIKQLGLPELILEQVITTLLRENFSNFFVSSSPFLSDVLDRLVDGANEVSRRGHNKALEQSLSSTRRGDVLKAFGWELQNCTIDKFILPDCVALGAERDLSESQPLMMLDIETLNSVIMPLSADLALVGSRDGKRVALSDFNLIAASCSHDFFVSSENLANQLVWSRQIGSRSWVVIEDAVTKAVEEMRGDGFPTASSQTSQFGPGSVGENEPIAENGPRTRQAARRGIEYYVRCVECDEVRFNKEMAPRIHEVVSGVASAVVLDRLDGIVVARDLFKISREIGGAPMWGSAYDGLGEYLAATFLIRQDGVLKGRIVLHEGVGRFLSAPQESERSTALGIVVQQLAHVALAQSIEESLPGVLLGPITDEYERVLYAQAGEAFGAYYSYRLSSGLNPLAGAAASSMLIRVLDSAMEIVPPVRFSYRYYENVDALMRVALSASAVAMRYAGAVLGHFDGLGETTDGEERLRSALNRIGLHPWFHDLHRDLLTLWERRGRWSSIDEFFALNRHLTRVLWQFGIFPWRTDVGKMYVEVPPAIGFRQGPLFPGPQLGS